MPRKKVVKNENKFLSPENVIELQEMVRLVNAKHFEVANVEKNTALIPEGQVYLSQIKAVASLLEGIRGQWTNQKLAEIGFVEGVKCHINLSTGEVTVDKE